MSCTGCLGLILGLIVCTLLGGPAGGLIYLGVLVVIALVALQ